jgi:hypothetical protein
MRVKSPQNRICLPSTSSLRLMMQPSNSERINDTNQYKLRNQPQKSMNTCNFKSQIQASRVILINLVI